MSTSWIKRKTRLATLLQSQGDEQADGLALDRLLHGQSVIGRTPKTAEVDSLRFTQNDLAVVGTLEYGQFSVIDVVNCNMNGRVYIRKTIEKRFAYKTRDQCNPQLERDILLRAKTAGTQWAPHLLCAFQSDTHLNLVMDYAEGGTLWDVLESSPDERIPEDDLRWWFPQVVSAIAWCHGQGFAHRDVKPHNFVLTQTSHVQLIDFGSAAPLLPPQSDGSRLIPREHCLVPCGTCDYISPEILQAHEAALVAMEMTEEEDVPVELDSSSGVNPYGAETDWWSMGAMLYEMAYGAAPFFANDIRTTYLKIVDFKKSLKFKSGLAVSAPLQDLIRRLLTDSHKRLGRRGVEQVKSHPFFGDPPWTDLHRLPRPENLHLPIFAYNQPPPPPPEAVPALDSSGSRSGSRSSSSDHSQGFAFSAFFQPSQESSPGLSILRSAPRPNKSILREQAATFFIGFSWGPPKDAFPSSSLSPPTHPRQTQTQTPRPLPAHHLTPTPFRTLPPSATPLRYPFATPHKPAQTTPNGFSTLPRASTVRRTAPRRAVSDREAMRQLVDCIGMSAQKKVLAAGRTPRTIGRTPAGGSLRRLGFALGPNGGGGTAKSLRFLPAPIEIGHNSHRRDVAVGEDTTAGSSVDASSRVLDWNMAASASASESESDGIPPSPSPSPRPGSAMSMLSRRSATPTTGTATGSWSLRLPPGWGGGGSSARRSSSPSQVVPARASDPRLASRLRDASLVESSSHTPRARAGHEPKAPPRSERLADSGTTTTARARAGSDAVAAKPRLSPHEEDAEGDTGTGDALDMLEHRYEHLMLEIVQLERRMGGVRGSSRARTHVR